VSVVWEQQDKLMSLDDLLHLLSPKQERVIRMRYGIGCEPQSLDEIGRCFNVGRERIRQVKNVALKKMSAFDMT